MTMRIHPITGEEQDTKIQLSKGFSYGYFQKQERPRSLKY
jgi:hypothetical protein